MLADTKDGVRFGRANPTGRGMELGSREMYGVSEGDRVTVDRCLFSSTPHHPG